MFKYYAPDTVAALDELITAIDAVVTDNAWPHDLLMPAVNALKAHLAADKTGYIPAHLIPQVMQAFDAMTAQPNPVVALATDKGVQEAVAKLKPLLAAPQVPPTTEAVPKIEPVGVAVPKHGLELPTGFEHMAEHEADTVEGEFIAKPIHPSLL